MTQRPHRATPDGLTTTPPPPSPSIPDEVAAAITDLQKQAQAQAMAQAPSSSVAASTGLGVPVDISQEEIDRAISQIVGHDFSVGGPGTFTTLSGVVLQIRRFPNEASMRIQRNMLPDRPKPPRRHSDADDKDYVDLEDIDYRTALEEYKAKAGDIGFYVRVSLGTKLHSVPSDGSVIPLEDDAWIDLIADPTLYGQYTPTIRRDGIARYVDWLQFYVLSEGDVRELYKVLDRASGIVQERDVIAAVNSFRGNR